jgi:hypothetical protein
LAARVADPAPAYCAACFQAKPGSPHVDFGSAYDGPVLVDDAGVRQSIDDLVVCESCVRDATRVLELHVAPIDDVERDRAAAERDARAWREYAVALEAAHARRPEPPRRGPGRPPRQPSRPVAA